MPKRRACRSISAASLASAAIYLSGTLKAVPAVPLIVSNQHPNRDRPKPNPPTNPRGATLAALSMTMRVDQWQPITTEPADGSDIWISDGTRVWLGKAHKDGSLKLPSRAACKFWMTAEIPAPPSGVDGEKGDKKAV